MENTKKQDLTQKKDRKEDIIVNGLKVFCEKGYESATVDDIVKKAGCSHGLFYHYFKSKKEVFDEVMAKHSALNFEEVQEKINSISSFKEKLKVIVENMYFNLIHDENSSYYFFFFLTQCFNYCNNNQSKHYELKKPEKTLPTILEELFSEGQKAGEFISKYSPEECTAMFLSIVQGATLGFTISPKDLNLKPKLPNVDFIVDVFSKGDSI